MLAASSGDIARLSSFSPNARRYLQFVFLTILNVGIYGIIMNLPLEVLSCSMQFMINSSNL
jgi:hypothetical protein